MNTVTNYPKLYEPLRIGKMQLKNHLMIPPMLPCLANSDGTASAELIAYCRNLAASGAGLICIGETPVDEDRSYDHPNALNLGNDRVIPRLSALVEEVHRYGAKLTIEVNHAGASANPMLLKGKCPLSPSPMPMYMHEAFRSTPVEIMDRAAMDQVKQNYLDAVGRVVTAGFDMVTIHCAHGWLLGQFLSPTFNTRDDEYGGCIENRMRFPLEIIQAVHERYGNQIAIDIRVSGSSRVPQEMIPGEENFDDLAVFLKAAEPYVDMVNVSASFAPAFMSSEYMIPNYFLPHMTNVEYAEKIKQVVHVPVAIAGGFTTLAQAESALLDGKADLIGMGRAVLADMKCFEKGAQGRENEIRPCLRCTKCAGCIQPPQFKGIRCAVNPQTGRELQYPHLPAAASKKKVLIVGGGPAGMEACQRCTQAGHEVVLYEASDRLGGLLYIASAYSFKEDMRSYLHWMVEQCNCSGATIHLNTTVTPEIIRSEEPDVVLVAIGSTPIIPQIPVAEGRSLLSIEDVVSHKAAIGKNVVIAGAGLSGLETAISLAKEGASVTIIDMMEPTHFLRNISGLVPLSIMRLINELHINVIFQARLTEIDTTGVIYTDAEQTAHSISCDTVINALGMRLNRDKISELMNVIPHSYAIGDCSGKQMSIENAVLDAFTVSYEI